MKKSKIKTTDYVCPVLKTHHFPIENEIMGASGKQEGGSTGTGENGELYDDVIQYDDEDEYFLEEFYY